MLLADLTVIVTLDAKHQAFVITDTIVGAVSPLVAATGAAAVALRTGAALAQSQIAEIQNALGLDASASIEAQATTCRFKTRAPPCDATRVSPLMILFYTDCGSVQQLSLASIAVT
uniref:hypothetical protein n=1 Tax=Burkholderia diffusa TaxID=488732 RepID=UPI001CC59606|nr:hypothetical protein [Burkholderia diffusa]